MANIIQEAKQIIYKSEIMLYITPERIEEAFSKIYVYNDKNSFLKAYGKGDFESGERLEGFNRSSGSYLGPDSTTHTVIHEVLHALSGEFDKDGHRIVDGISGDGSLQFAQQVNEGITDYIASKLSGERPRHYIQGHKLFARLEPMIVRYTNNPSALMQIYLNKDVQFMHDFLNYYGKDNVFENLYENFLFMEDEKLNVLLDKVEKNLYKDLRKRDRKEKFNNFVDKVKNIFKGRNNKAKMLIEGTEHYYNYSKNNEKIDSHQQFVNQYDIDNFQSQMTQQDIEMYTQNQQSKNYNIDENNFDNQR